MTDSETEFRPLEPHEKALLLHLMKDGFPGRDEALAQVENARVRLAPSCIPHGCGTLEIRVDTGPLLPPTGRFKDVPYGPGRGSVHRKLPPEGRYTDTTGLPVEILLFQQNGRLREMEFVVYGPGPRGKYQTPSEVDVYVAPT